MKTPKPGLPFAHSKCGHAAWVERAAGFTLVEVLVAVVFLSFGLLGVVGLLAASLRANRDARLQSSAVRLSRELADLMRGNKNVALAAGNPYLVDVVAAPAAVAGAPDCFAAACASPTDLSTFQIQDWLTRVFRELPGSVRVVVCFDDQPYDGGSGANGLPHWDCPGQNADQTVQAVVKLGWTQLSTDRKLTGANRLVTAATRPTIVLPLVSGSTQ